MTRDIAAQRHRAILARLETSGSVTVEELSRVLGVSRETIRRDLKVLSVDGRLSIVHGGALHSESSEAPFTNRRTVNRAGKEAIARLAASLVGDGMTILLDSGTTTEAVARALVRCGCRPLPPHTPAPANARIVSRLAGVRVYLIGGEFDRNEEASSGPEARRAIARLSADFAFASIGGVDEEGFLTDYTRTGATTRSALIKAAERGFLMADSSKFGRVLPSRIAGDAQCAGLLVDRELPLPIAMALGARGIRVVIG